MEKLPSGFIGLTRSGESPRRDMSRRVRTEVHRSGQGRCDSGDPVKSWGRCLVLKGSGGRQSRLTVPGLMRKDEIILCTYIARFGRRFIDEGQICSLSHIRSVASIKANVSNIAHMMLEEGYGCSRKVSPLSGKPTGEQGRRTNWEVVRTLVDLTEPEFKRQITEILSCHA